jgi:hypothetical protein
LKLCTNPAACDQRDSRAQGANHHGRTFRIFQHDKLVDAYGINPISAQAALGSPTRRALKARIDPRASNELGPLAGERASWY